MIVSLAHVCVASGAAQEIQCRLERAGAAEFTVAPFVPVIEIPRLAVSPEINGEAGESEWAGAAVINGFSLPAGSPGAAPSTLCRLGFDDEALFVAFCCGMAPGTVLRTNVKTSGGAVFDDDSIEFFIWPDGSKPHYFQIAVNTAAAQYTAKCAFDPGTCVKTSSDTSWAPEWKTAATTGQDSWTVEMAVPWETLGIAPRNIKGLRFNCCRNSVADFSPHSSWAFLPKPNFHRPDWFGIGICRFDGNAAPAGGPDEIGLGMAGVCRIASRNGDIMQTSPEIEIFCQAALPAHPLFEGWKTGLEVDAAGIDAGGGQEAPDLPDARFDLPSSEPHKLVVSCPADADFILSLRMGMDGAERSRSSFLVIPGYWSEILGRFGKADLRALAGEQPFKAAGFAGAAACVEKMRSAPSAAAMSLNLMEALARLDVLENGETRTPDSMLALLNLAGHPESQVAVEYPASLSATARPNSASVTFHAGSIPLCSVWVRQVPDAEKAAESLAGKKGARVFEGNPASAQTNVLGISAFYAKDFAPARHALMVSKRFGRPWACALDIKNLDLLLDMDRAAFPTPVVALLPGCPGAVAEIIGAWAEKNDVKRIPPEDAAASDAVLFAGDAMTAAAKLGVARARIGIMYKQARTSVNFEVLRGRDSFSLAGAPSMEVAELAMRLAMAGKAVAPADIDALRRAIVAAYAPQASECAAPAGQSFFCGDVHLHTTASDGATSPIATALQTLYCLMDFAVMSDHNTLEGAFEAINLLERHGFAYPLIVGEEITAAWAHLNAYPLREVVPWTVTPEEAIKAAHAQGAVIQWNHPGYTDSEFESSHFMTGVRGTGCDAWEHHVWLHDEWKAAGELPIMLGSTDSHSGSFGWPERTLMLGAAPGGEALADAVRQGRVLMLSPSGGHFFYGSDEMVKYAWSALKDGQALQKQKAALLKKALENADLAGLIERRR